MKVKEKKIAPDFTLPDQKGKEHTLSGYLGKWVLLYFYPKDDTPGCTVEAETMRDNLTAFKRAGAVVFGVSPDSVKSHKKFSDKFKLSFSILADEEKKVIKKYGVWGKKKFMGREYMGVERSSVLINPKGVVAKVYPKVKPAEHAKEVLADLKALK
jgi:peroxiredoxin Q/BCP